MLRGRTCRLPVAAPCLRPGRFSSSCLKTFFVQVSRSDRDIFVSVVIHVSGVGVRVICSSEGSSMIFHVLKMRHTESHALT